MSLRPILTLAAGTLLLASGCVYDPYTGTYVPCCAYPAYGYYPYGRPAPGPAPGRIEPGPPPGAYQPQSYESQPGESQPGDSPQSYAAPASTPQQGGGMAQRFATANTTQDGRLTLAQAQAARWQAVVRNFSAIDAAGKGYVTLADLRAWKAARKPPVAAG